eukprot:GHVN01019612.1.p1 GENE.GHVN01019612.1~~GHVN01019612.1.p1  ORF type:complete len:1092 (+),score=129.32 GHVN01019612.1:382-3657(+)
MKVVETFSGNDAKTTVVQMGYRPAQLIRIAMTGFGNPVGDTLSYAINGVHAMANDLSSIVESCDAADKTRDARDKFFLVGVENYDGSPAKEAAAKSKQIAELQARCGELKSSLEDSHVRIDDCAERENGNTLRAKALRTTTDRIQDKLTQVALKYNEIHHDKDLPPGSSISNPATDCTHASHLFAVEEENPLSRFWEIPHIPFITDAPMVTEASERSIEKQPANGFIWAKFKRTASPIRVFCENQGRKGAYHVLSGVEEAHRAEACDSLGMQLADDKMIENPALMAALTRMTPSGSTSRAVCFFANPQSAPSMPYVELSCADTIRNRSEFEGLPEGTVLNVYCPHECASNVDGLVAGSGPYRDDSSVCLAALHSGHLDQEKLASVTIGGAKADFIASDRNGVKSVAGEERAERTFAIDAAANSLAKPETEQKVAIKPHAEAKEDAEVDALVEEANAAGKPESLAGSSFVEVEPTVSTSINHASKHDKSMGEGTVAETMIVRSIQNERAVPVPGVLDSTYLNKAYAKLYHINEHRAATSEDLQELEEDMNRIADRVSGILKTAISESERQNFAIDILSDQVDLQSGFLPWTFDPHGKHFTEVFDVRSTGTAKSPGIWRFSPSGGTGERGTVIAFDSEYEKKEKEAVGSFAALRSKKWYDFSLAAEIKIEGRYSSGILFRMTDFQNFYMLELRGRESKKGGITEGGWKRLLRVTDGHVKVLYTHVDGGYVPGQWAKVKISAVQSRIKIYVNNSQQPVLDVIDDIHSAGTIGFFASGQRVMLVDNVKVTPAECKRPTKASLAPLPPACSHYYQDYSAPFEKVWEVNDPHDAMNGPSDWAYSTQAVGGHYPVLRQSSKIGGRGEQSEGSRVVLQGRRTCSNGTWGVKFFPQCHGTIGLVFRNVKPDNYFVVEMTPSMVKLRKSVDGELVLVSETTQSGYRVGDWNEVQISFQDDSLVTAFTHTNGTLYTVLASRSIDDFHGGRVGLSTAFCEGVAFTDMHLRPSDSGMDELAQVVADEVALPVAQPSFASISTTEVCTANHHWIDRSKHCREIKAIPTIVVGKARHLSIDENANKTESNIKRACESDLTIGYQVT